HCVCGYTAHRDVNAARNILQKALGSVRAFVEETAVAAQ
ncbi:transposase, partial [Hazenella sp. IB182353]|nr:transposase [Polycladospora coralii]MBS7529679.1 transposase [Polycladospora coralii]